jgi:hypothetical protein
LAIPSSPPEEEFVRIPARRPPAFWFEKNESLGKRGDDAEFWMPFESVLFVRLIPTDLSQRLISHELAGRAASTYGSFERFGDLYILRNDDGAAMCELDGQRKNVTSIAQYFNNGEIWGINATIPRLAERGKFQYLLMDQVEELFRTQVPRFIDCMTREFSASLPIRLVGGVAGIKGRLIAWNGGPGNGYTKMIKASVEHERNLNQVDQPALDQFLLELFEKILEASGKRRPKNFNGFPP